MSRTRPYALSVAGFDPSAGAGVLADVKTFEANKVYGLAAITGITFQHESGIEGIKWLDQEDIIKQIKVLSAKYRFQYVKMGLVENAEMMEAIVSWLHNNIMGAVIVWDPVIETSSGFKIHSSFERKILENICKNIFLITPNTEEAEKLAGGTDALEAAGDLSKYCNVFLKGGHNKEQKGKDFLFMKGGKRFSFNPKTKKFFPKHGSGCVLSAAITAKLAKGYKLHGACLRGKEYAEKFLSSNEILLGYHK